MNYHHESKESLVGYSGLIACNTSDNLSYTNANNLSPYIYNLNRLFDLVDGSFAVFKISDRSFECLTDTLSTHKIFYWQGNEKEVYVSNRLELIKLFVRPDPNLLFYLQYVAAGGLYGNSTDHECIFTTPGCGRLRWNASDGLQVDRYEPLETIISNEETYEDLIRQTSLQLKNVARNLVTYHKPVVSLSGGFDSRVALNMFWGLNKENVTAYTFPDISIDTKIAKRLASIHGVTHHLLRPCSQPDIRELEDFIQEYHAPFFDYNHVFGYVINDEIQAILSKKNAVLLTGLGGATHFGVSGYKKVLDFKEKEAIICLTEYLIKKSYLTDNGYQALKKHMINYYIEEYLPLLNKNTPSYHLANYHFFFERFGNYQALKNHINSSENNYYIPFGNKCFLQSVFASPKEKLFRHKKYSIHHELNYQITNGSTSPIPFTKNIHWDATKLNRIEYRLQRQIKQSLINRLKVEKKYSDQVRRSFFYDYLPHYKEIIHSYKKSELWDYFDHEKLNNLLMQENLYENHSSFISKIVPLLKMNI
ncbi:MAG: hypothetical protein JJU37_17120 [Balneolaceae bacterium]|nr:hypothetical protein [Balneolaceae bacterium]